MAKYTLKSKVLTKGKSMYHKWGVKNGLTFVQTLDLTLWNQMIPDFPHNIKIRLAPIFFYNMRKVWYQNLNSKLFQFHTVPNNSYHFWADLLHKWSFLGYNWQHPWIYPKCHAYLLYYSIFHGLHLIIFS